MKLVVNNYIGAVEVLIICLGMKKDTIEAKNWGWFQSKVGDTSGLRMDLSLRRDIMQKYRE